MRLPFPLLLLHTFSSALALVGWFTRPGCLFLLRFYFIFLDTRVCVHFEVARISWCCCAVIFWNNNSAWVNVHFWVTPPLHIRLPAVFSLTFHLVKQQQLFIIIFGLVWLGFVCWCSVAALLFCLLYHFAWFHICWCGGTLFYVYWNNAKNINCTLGTAHRSVRCHVNDLCTQP